MRMELIDLMKKISEDNIPHFLILFGEEQKIIDIYINNIREIGRASCRERV